MERLLMLALVYGWLGFTVGYFFHKWMERNLIHRNAAESATIAKDEGLRREPQ